MTRRWVPRRAWRILRPGHTYKAVRTGGVIDPATAPTVAEGACNGVTHDVGSLPEWEQAMAAAEPGDVVRLTARVDGRLIYRGGDPTAGAGSAAEPIIITADPGVWVGTLAGADVEDLDDWPGPDLSPCTADLIWEDEIRAEIEAKRRGHGGGS